MQKILFMGFDMYDTFLSTQLMNVAWKTMTMDTLLEVHIWFDGKMNIWLDMNIYVSDNDYETMNFQLLIFVVDLSSTHWYTCY